MSDSIKIIALRCTSCGGRLEISPDMSEVACGYCGTNLAIERRGGTVALRMVTEAIGKVQAGTDKTAAELAIRRLSEEIADLQRNRAEWVKYKNERSLLLQNQLIGGIVVAVVSASLITAVITRFGDPGISFVILVVILALIITPIVWLNTSAKKRLMLKVAEELRPFDNAIADKEQRLRKNRAIAES